MVDDIAPVSVNKGHAPFPHFPGAPFRQIDQKQSRVEIAHSGLQSNSRLGVRADAVLHRRQHLAVQWRVPKLAERFADDHITICIQHPVNSFRQHLSDEQSGIGADGNVPAHVQPELFLPLKERKKHNFSIGKPAHHFPKFISVLRRDIIVDHVQQDIFKLGVVPEQGVDRHAHMLGIVIVAGIQDIHPLCIICHVLLPSPG